MAPKSQPVRVTLTAAPTESSTEQVNLENPGDDFKRCVWWRPRRNHRGIFLGRLPDPVQAGPFTAAQLATIQDTVSSSLDQAFHSPGLSLTALCVLAPTTAKLPAPTPILNASRPRTALSASVSTDHPDATRLPALSPMSADPQTIPLSPVLAVSTRLTAAQTDPVT